MVLKMTLIILNVKDNLKTFYEVMSFRDVAFRKEAVNDEMNSILSDNSMVLIDLSPDSKPIGCKWVF